MIEDNVHPVANKRERKKNRKEIDEQKFLLGTLKITNKELFLCMQEYNKKSLMTIDGQKPSTTVSSFRLI